MHGMPRHFSINPYRLPSAMIMYRLDEGVIGSGMGLFLIVGHWLKILPQNSKGTS